MHVTVTNTCLTYCRFKSLSLSIRTNVSQLHYGYVNQNPKQIRAISRLCCSSDGGPRSSTNITIPRHYSSQPREISCPQKGYLNRNDSNLRLENVKNNLQMQNIRMFSLQSAVESVAQTQAGWFKSLSESTVVGYAQDFLVSVHDITGLPWASSIILTTVIVRAAVTMPLAIYQNYVLAKVENLQVEMANIVKELKIETAYAVKKYGWTEKHARNIYNRSLRKQWKQLIVRDNCHPFKASLVLWVQLPMWICFSTAMRNLVYMLPESTPAAQVVFLEMSVGGFGWIPNLTVPDTSLILPVVFGLVNLAIIELQVITRVKKSSKIQRIATNAFRILSFVMIPVAASVPSCLSLYWTTSSIFGLGQNLLLLSPKIKRVTGIPSSASQLQQPYRHIADKIKARVAWFSSK